ncbi:hypothetical protein H072_213 [Dactylellina haptotyla CBS 200.50]|uniref:Peptidase A1 domain-containing protein n=1 Tax=Dactylellina haptotyla (strain CBS 200.50) TaxID=1284197 RepID=S8C244_DACHA|nr:hypothetical protein H072_213 [Dactylellina haptotyla CBS 200.50]
MAPPKQSFGILAMLLLCLQCLFPAVLGAVAAKHQQPIIRDTISTYNVSFDTEDFDNLGDLDWRPIIGPFQGLIWNNFRVGANKHFFQTSGGKDAFVAIPLDESKNILHTADPSLFASYNDSGVSSFDLKSLLFGCALYSGIPVECAVEFSGFDKSGMKVASAIGKFTPPYAHINSMGRLEAGKAALQPWEFSRRFSNIRELRFSVNSFTVLYKADPGKESPMPVDVAYSNSLLLIVDGVSYVTNATAMPEQDPTSAVQSTASAIATQEKRATKDVTDCFDLDGDITFNSFPLPYKDIFYDGFFRSKHLLGYYNNPCEAKSPNVSTGHIYAAGVRPYNDLASSVFPSIGIDYFGSKRKDMSIKSFYIGCEQFLEDNTVLETGAPCTIGIVSLVTQKSGDKPQEVHYQEVSIAKPQSAPPEDTGLEFVELIDGNHITKLYFVLVSGDSQAQSAAIILDNLTYHTRKGKWPHTGNRQIKPPGVQKVDDILMAISRGHERSITAQSEESVQERLENPALNETIDQAAPAYSPRMKYRGNDKSKRNITFTFTTPANVDKTTGDFPIASTEPFLFGPEWRGHAQDAQGNPQHNFFYRNTTWAFGPINSNRTSFAYTEIPWRIRGDPLWDTAKAVIRIPPPNSAKFLIKSLQTSCYPAFLTDEDTNLFDNQGPEHDFTCHYTVLGYKSKFKEEPAEHAMDFDDKSNNWKIWSLSEFPLNYAGVDILEFHATWASTRNVRIFIDDVTYQTV